MWDTPKIHAYEAQVCRIVVLAVCCALASLAALVAAAAHAFLDHAMPGVGGTVRGVPTELDLPFTQNVVVALFGITVAPVGGGAVSAARPTLDGANPSLPHVRLRQALAPGTYLVTWHVVSIDTHPTSGTCKFAVAP